MADLIPPHGGLSEPVCRTVPASEAQAFQTEAAKLPKVPVSAADLSTIYRIADGTLSPLTGPMNKAVYNRVLDEAVMVIRRQLSSNDLGRNQRGQLGGMA